MAAMRMSVKNTFVHIDDDDLNNEDVAAVAMASRRSSSVPRSLRFGGSFEDSALKRTDQDGTNRAPSSCAEVSTEAELSEAENESNGSTTPPSPSPTRRTISIAVEGASDAPPPAFLAMAMIPVVPQSLEPDAPRARLNSKAEAWTPGASTSAASLCAPAIFGACSQHVTLLLATTVAAIRRVPGLKDVQATPPSNGSTEWSIVIKLPMDTFEKRRHQAIAVAKQGLVMATSATPGVHLLCSMAEPFSTTAFGCTATLVTVADENQVCWDSLAIGFCPRGLCCRWQHSTCHTGVHVVVKIADETA